MGEDFIYVSIYGLSGLSEETEEKAKLRGLFVRSKDKCGLSSNEREQSFLIKTEGFGWTRVTFHSRQLKSQEELQISSSRQLSLRQTVLLFLSSLSALFQARTKLRKITLNL
ncbi:hypothetical protein Q8A73_004591 [Channa argus]|nr:hypothetical protein Q8A73_004591 [Channa argus]